MAGRIFVNYRRDDSASHALNVAQYLEATFGKRNVFLDIDRMRAGQSFPTVLKERLSASKVMLAVIGPKWLELRNEHGERRIADASDWVRLEIATALQSGTVVIPVLVGGATLPRKGDLPPDLQPLTDQHAVTVTTNGFRNEMAGLARDIRAIPGPMPWGMIGGGAAAVLAVVLGGWTAAYQLGVPVWVPGRNATTIVDPAVEAARRATEAAKIKVDADRLADAEAKLLAAQEAQKKAEATAKQLADAADKAKRDQEAREKAAREAAARKQAEDDARAKASAEAEAKRKAEEEARARAAAVEAKRLDDLAAAEARRKAQEMSPGRVFRDCNDGCPEMVVVPAGSFMMGSNEYDSEKPPRTVTLRQNFAVGKFEVTFAEWEACVAGGGCQGNKQPRDFGWGRGRWPVVDVSWNDAKEYVAWLSRKTGQTYRLLTEAEWEYAARARGTGKWTFGDDERRLGEFAWYSANSGSKTQPVGGKTQNAYGLHDMHGNVWEWVEDCWHADYNGAPSDGSAWAAACTNGNARVVRGGSWNHGPVILRSADRNWLTTTVRYGYLGLRVARVVSR